MTRRSPHLLALAVVLSLLAVALPAASSSAADPQPDAVSVPGDFNSEIGCAADWSPDCPAAQLTRRSDDDVWSLTVALPAGTFNYKAALNNSWDVNYGLHAVAGGDNIPLVVPDGGASVSFYYDNATHWVTADISTPIVTAAGDFQSELGCPADWSPDCLRSWLEDPDGDGTYTFVTTGIPAGDWQAKAAVGLSWDENYGAGGAPGGANIPFTVAHDGDATTFSYDATSHVLTITSGSGGPVINLKTPRAYWLSQRWIGWDLGADAVNRTYRLYAAPEGGLAAGDAGITGGTWIPLQRSASGLPAAIKAMFPAQAGLAALQIPAKYAAQVKELLRGQVAVVALDGSGAVVDGSGLQIPGVLDDIYAGATRRTLGLSWSGNRPSLALWAPTARAVAVKVYADGTSTAAIASRTMSRSADGVWTVRGDASWKNRYFLYDVTVFVPETGAMQDNLVTDPYSVGLSQNSTRSLFVNLNDAALKPAGWARLAKPALPNPETQSIYELHLRDFSASDPTVPAAHRGTYEAFTDSNSNAAKHLEALAQSGLTTVHLLPLADIATINEDKSTWQSPACDLPALPPDSQQQQACTSAVAANDGFNWGYDPLHYTTPEGSYATDPNGSPRTRQFRDMVSALNHDHLRVVMDMVYNHTTDAGQNGKNDLDRIVPGYYHRLNATGAVGTSTCCANTATEHAMMGKLMIDSVLTWATDYKVDGFRFDLMGHQPKALMQQLRKDLNQLTVAKDGVDGKKVYLYGEGWNFGEVANDALFTQATQANMAGTGIGTFNDRIRDAVRGGGPFDTDPRIQGFASGLYTDPNGASINGTADQQKATLLHEQDLIKVGLTGNLKDYPLVDAAGNAVTGAGVDYNGSPAGYTSDPQEAINYVEAHDNQTLFDALTEKLPVATSMADRLRMQNLALSTVALSQGVAFWHAGGDILRSKSFDGNSYVSGDWFNVLDPSYSTNGFGRGLPPAASNQALWPYVQPLLANPALKPSSADIQTALADSEALLRLRNSTPLFHLGTAARVQQKLSFVGAGPSQTPGVITMRIDDTVGADVDRSLRGLVVVFNASPTATTQTVSGIAGQAFQLSPIQASGSDLVVKTSTYAASTGTFTVPPRTVAVFVSPQP